MVEMPTKVMALVERVAERGLDSLAYLDPEKEDEREAIEYFLDRAGKGADRYPALHTAKAGGGTATPATPLDHCTLVDMGKAADGTALAQAWLGSVGGSFLSGVHTMLLDVGSGEVLAFGSTTQVGGGLVRGRTGDGALAATPKMTGVSFFHAQRSPQEPLRFGLTAAPVVLPESEPTIAIGAPIEVRGKRPGRVVIGMARQEGWSNTDCDYIYPEAGSVEPDRLVVPFEGTVEFAESVMMPAVNIRTALWCDHFPLKVWETAEQLEQGFKQESPTKISWSFPYDDLSISATKSLKYDPLPEADDNVSAFFFRFQLKSGQGELLTVSIFSTSWLDKPTSGYKKEIDDLEYWWHCVDAEAEVTLGDGSSKKLIEIDNQTEVRLLGGGNSLVEATTLDVHDIDSEDVVMKLTTSGGRSLIVSALHPAMSGGQPVMARDLQPGQEIAVEGGTDQVASCLPEAGFQGKLGNLSLAATGTQAFYANGIAVGDFGTLTAYREQVRHDPEYMLARLPESHHQDYLSGLADATA